MWLVTYLCGKLKSKVNVNFHKNVLKIYKKKDDKFIHCDQTMENLGKKIKFTKVFFTLKMV